MEKFLKFTVIVSVVTLLFLGAIRTTSAISLQNSNIIKIYDHKDNIPDAENTSVYNQTNNPADQQKYSIDDVPDTVVNIENGEVVFTKTVTLEGGVPIIEDMQKHLENNNPYLYSVFNDIAQRVMNNPDIPEYDKTVTIAVLFYNLDFGRDAQGVDVRASGNNPLLTTYKKTLSEQDRETVDNIMRTHDNIASNYKKGRFMSRDDRDALDKIYAEYGELTGDDMDNYLLTVFAQIIDKDWEKKKFMDPNNLIGDFISTKSDEALQGMLGPMSGALQTPYYTPGQILSMSHDKLVGAITLLAERIASWASKEKHNPSKPYYVSKADQQKYSDVDF